MKTKPEYLDGSQDQNVNSIFHPIDMTVMKSKLNEAFLYYVTKYATSNGHCEIPDLGVSCDIKVISVDGISKFYL